MPMHGGSTAGARRRSGLARLIGVALLGLEAALTASSGYLLGLLVAARGSTRTPAVPPAGDAGRELRLVVLVPAHDEAGGIEATLESLAGCEYPLDARRVVVVADNCTDETAALSSHAGAEVWERTDPVRRGKGHALAWALQRLFGEEDGFDAVAMVDADCLVSPNMLSAIDRRLRAGAGAVQVDYVAGNPGASHVSALRFAAFALTDTVRFLGKERLGLSCGLVGTGMAFTRELLRRAPWTATGLVEDSEYHMRLVLAGERAEFVAEASVSQAVPTSLRASSEQQARWERGRLELIRRWSPRLLAAGLAKHDVVRLHAGLECLLPPQSLIAIGNLASAVAGFLLGSRRLLALSSLGLGAQLAFVLGGLRLVRAPAHVYRALLFAPMLIASKLALYARFLSGRGPDSWVRTERP
jgi:hypothetical protein